MTWYEAFVQLEPVIKLDMPDFADEIYAESNQREPKAEPRVPEWLKDIVCSDKPLVEKRAELDACIMDDDDFVAWVLLAMKLVEAIRRSEDVKAFGLGYSGWDGDKFRGMAADLLNRGYVPLGDLIYCQRPKLKHPLESSEPVCRTHLGKHGEQIIALIALVAGCPWYVPPRIARKMGINLRREKQEQRDRWYQSLIPKRSEAARPEATGGEGRASGLERTV